MQLRLPAAYFYCLRFNKWTNRIVDSDKIYGLGFFQGVIY